MRKQYITKILTGTLVVALFTGCGLSNTAGDTVSDGAVSGSAVSGGAVAPDKRKVKDQAEKEENKAMEVENCLANDDNQYYEDWSAADSKILVQTRLDGSHKKKIKLEDLEDICWVTNEWVYYIGEKHEDDVLYRIPIRKTKQGDTLLLKKRETVTSSYVIESDIYVTDTYIIYCTEDWDDERDKYECGVYKLDLQNGEEKRLWELTTADECAEFCFFFSWSSAKKKCPVMRSGKLFMDEWGGGNEERLWSLDPETEEMKQLALGDEFYCEVRQDQIWFFDEDGSSIYRYDEKREEAVRVLTPEKLREVLLQEGLWKKKFDVDDMWICDTYYYKGRFYLEIYVENTRDGVDVLLSSSLQNPEDIRYEKAASDFLMSYDWKVCYQEVEDVRDGKMLLYVENEETWKDMYGVYDLDTKELRRISEKKADQLFYGE